MELLPELGEPRCLAQYLICLKILFQRHAYLTHVVVIAKFYPKHIKSEQYRSISVKCIQLLARYDLVNRIVQDKELHFAFHSHLLQSS